MSGARVWSLGTTLAMEKRHRYRLANGRDSSSNRLPSSRTSSGRTLRPSAPPTITTTLRDRRPCTQLVGRRRALRTLTKSERFTSASG